MAALKAPVLDGTGKQSSEHTLEESVFGAEVKPHLVHETVRAELANARAGTTRAPHWTGGGAAFAPRTNFGVKVNRKERRAAFRSALSAHAAEGTLGLVDGSAFDAPSTKQAIALLAEWGKDAPVLVVASDGEEALVKSFRNVDRVVVTVPTELEVRDVVWARALLVSEEALELIVRRAQ